MVSEKQEHSNVQIPDEPEEEYDDVPVEDSDLALYQQHNQQVQDRIALVTNQAGKNAAERQGHELVPVHIGNSKGDSDKSTVAIVQSTREDQRMDTNSVMVKPRRDSPAWKNLTQLAFLLLAATVSVPALRTWQSESAQIGYCDNGSNVNDRILQDRQHRAKRIEWKKQVIENPQVQAAASLDDEAFYEVLGIAPPDSCTPCPEHAICQDGALARCQQGYQLVLDWRQSDLVNTIFDGLPGLGPVAFPPSCQIDFKRKALGARIAKEIESDLAKRHGEVLCSQGLWSTDELGDQLQVVRHGMSEQELRDMLFAKVCRAISSTPAADPVHQMKLSEVDFKEQFDIAIKDLLAYNNIQAAVEK